MKNLVSKFLPIVAGIILGGLFVMAAVMVLFGLASQPEIPEGTPMSHFMSAFGPTGYMKFIKVFELLGGILVAIPTLRNIGLLVLGPIIVNIIAFHVFITGGTGLLEPMLIVIVLCALYLFWVERRSFAGLVNRPARKG